MEKESRIMAERFLLTTDRRRIPLDAAIDERERRFATGDDAHMLDRYALELAIDLAGRLDREGERAPERAASLASRLMRRRMTLAPAC
jgi:hypothetical protein